MVICNFAIPPQVKPLLWSPPGTACALSMKYLQELFSTLVLQSKNQESPVPPGLGALEFILPFCLGKSHGKPQGKAATDTTGHRDTNGCGNNTRNREKRQKPKGITSASVHSLTHPAAPPPVQRLWRAPAQTQIFIFRLYLESVSGRINLSSPFGLLMSLQTFVFLLKQEIQILFGFFWRCIYICSSILTGVYICLSILIGFGGFIFVSVF